MKIALAPCRGFTLIELSVVITIIAVILSGGMSILIASTQATQYNATINTMNTIEQALQNYAVAFNRLPCPSSLIATATSQYYGVEAANPGTGNCINGSPAANSTYQATGNTYAAAEGGVPTVSLKLPDSYMYDAWGRRIRYAVDTTLTAINTNISSGSCNVTGTCIGTGFNAAFPPPVGAVCSTSASKTAMTVYDETGATRSTNAAYVLISHGANGHGAYTAAGTVLNAGSNNTAEQSNCHCTSSAGSNTYNAQYYQEAPQYQSSHINSLTYYYDDIVAFKESWQLRSAISSSVSSNCSKNVYVTDWGNSRVIEMSTTGTYINAWGTGYNGVGGTVGSAGNKDGQLDDPYFTLMDSSGNLWIYDAMNYRIQEISSSGQWMMTIGGTTSQACSGTYKTATTCNKLQGYSACCAPGSACTCSSGATTGEFNPGGSTNAGQLAFDANGNLWATDFANNRVEEFYTSGAKIGTYEGGFGLPGSPDGIAIDSSGYIWVVMPNDSGSVLKYNSSGGLQATYANMVGSGGAPSDYFFFDSSGNLWLSDTANSRVIEINTSNGSVLKTVSLSGAPMGVAIDSNEDIWWSNSSTGDTVVQTSPGNTNLQSIGTSGSGTSPIGFSEPQNIFFSSR